MRAFRASGAHLKAMPKLLTWCDEASIAHWTAADSDVPTTEAAFERMKREGRLSKVHRPSSRHRDGGLVGERPPRVGLQLSPR